MLELDRSFFKIGVEKIKQQQKHTQTHTNHQSENYQVKLY